MKPSLLQRLAPLPMPSRILPSIQSKSLPVNTWRSLVKKSSKCRQQGRSTLSTRDSMVDSDSEIITIIAGEDIENEHASELSQAIEEKYDLDVELVMGGQPVYSYIVGVE